MTRPLRLLQVAPFPVLPARAGGKIRIVKLARALAALGVDVTIVAPYHPTQRRAIGEAEPFRLVQVPYPFLVHSLLTERPLPYGALVSFHPGFRALLTLDLQAFDVCQLEHPAFADLLRGLPPATRVVYDAQNVELDYACSESPAGAVRRLVARRMRSLESRLVERADHVFACSEPDRRRFVELYGAGEARTSLLPNGIGLDEVDAAREAAAVKPLPADFALRALFTGSAVAHNHEAVKAILSRVAPAVAQQVQVVILGACARRFRRRPGPNVVLDPGGSLAEYAVAGTVGLNPVDQGSGTSLKLLDYLAHGLPVLSTPFGLRGLEDLAPFVRKAALHEFPAALGSGLAPPSGARDALSRYAWRRIAADALRVYLRLVWNDGPARHG
ncbi:MAG: glycosyltransferase [Myxococcota bacterium]|nr:glycosyltransferase [Myxococcota bacterium]